MKYVKYILIWFAMAVSWGVFQGMATAPKQEVIAACYSQPVTTYVNGILQNCLDDCGKTHVAMGFPNEDCNNTCTGQALVYINQMRDLIINRQGNVL